MRKQFITFFLFSFSLISFSASFVFGFSGASSRSLAPQNPAININCLNCHGKLSQLPSSLKIDESAFNASAHATLSCLDCHPVSSLKEGPVPHEKKLPSPDCTASCHRQPPRPDRPSPPLSYKDSVHGRAYLERGKKNVARCWDCHGKHNILPASHPQSTVNRMNIPRTCSVCHENMAVVIKYHIHREAPYQEYSQSVHGRSLFTGGVSTFAAVCTDCHGVHNIQGVGEPHLMARQPTTCAHCHEQIYLKYKESIHGIAALKGDPSAPLCVDCHGEHKIISASEATSSTYFQNIPQTCATCHARPDIMRKYGIPVDRVATFIESLHGIALGYGLKGVATCVSCHGSHEILPASDPRSSIHPLNLVRTCNQSGCHSGMPESVARTKIHVGPSASPRGALFYFERILMALVILTILITLIWFIPGFIRRLRRFKGKKG